MLVPSATHSFPPARTLPRMCGRDIGSGRARTDDDAAAAGEEAATPSFPDAADEPTPVTGDAAAPIPPAGDDSLSFAVGLGATAGGEDVAEPLPLSLLSDALAEGGDSAVGDGAELAESWPADFFAGLPSGGALLLDDALSLLLVALAVGGASGRCRTVPGMAASAGLDDPETDKNLKAAAKTPSCKQLKTSRQNVDRCETLLLCRPYRPHLD